MLTINELDKWEKLNEPCEFCEVIDFHEVAEGQRRFTPAKYHIYVHSNGYEFLLCEKCKGVAELIDMIDEANEVFDK